MEPGQRHHAGVDEEACEAVWTGDPADSGPTSATLVLVATMATAFVAQGGFYGSAQWLIAIGLAAAWFLAARRSITEPAVGLGTLAATSMAALAAWATVRGAFADELMAGLTRAGLLAAIAIVVAVCRRGTSADRDHLELTGLVIGVGIAVTGWIGVAAHLRPWAVSGSSTWRAASTLTYPNAAAAALVAVSLVAIARRTTRPQSLALAVSTTLCLTGAFATQSRAGAVGFAVGAAVLFLVLGPRRVIAATIAPAVGAAVATVALVPGIRVGDPARPVIAALGLGIGLSIAAADALLAARTDAGRRTLAIISGVAGAVVVGASIVGGVAAAVGDRVSIGSADREGTNLAALDVIADHPIVGVGPGRLTVSWTTQSGVVGTRLVHNEYAQLVAELGIVGGILLAALLVATALIVLRARGPQPSTRWAGAVAALAALLVHSAFDFLWHIPAIVLMGAALVGLATCLDDPTSSSIHPPHQSTTPRR